MSYKAVLIWAAFLLPRTCWPQQVSSTLSAKTLYYQGQQDDETQPPQIETKRTQPRKTTPAKNSTKSPGQAQNGQTDPRQNAASTLVAQVAHLGLRYNVVLVDQQSRKSTPVDRDRVFQPGECIQLEFSPNRSGYLYIFDQGSSGRWQVMFPSNLMTDEINAVKAREAVEIPSNYCFKVGSPPGTERLFVVLSRNEEDMYSLDRAIRASGQNPGVPTTPRSQASPPVLESENKLDIEIDHMKSSLGTKDLSIEKIGEPDQPGEPANAVYLVNSSSAPSDHLVSEVLIRHR